MTIWRKLWHWRHMRIGRKWHDLERFLGVELSGAERWRERHAAYVRSLRRERDAAAEAYRQLGGDPGEVAERAKVGKPWFVSRPPGE